MEDVRIRGDAAVRNFTEKFDKVQLTSVCVPIEVRAAVVEEIGGASTLCRAYLTWPPE